MIVVANLQKSGNLRKRKTLCFVNPSKLFNFAWFLMGFLSFGTNLDNINNKI